MRVGYWFDTCGGDLTFQGNEGVDFGYFPQKGFSEWHNSMNLLVPTPYFSSRRVFCLVVIMKT